MVSRTPACSDFRAMAKRRVERAAYSLQDPDNVQYWRIPLAIPQTGDAPEGSADILRFGVTSAVGGPEHVVDHRNSSGLLRSLRSRHTVERLPYMVRPQCHSRRTGRAPGADDGPDRCDLRGEVVCHRQLTARARREVRWHSIRREPAGGTNIGVRGLCPAS